MKGYLWTGGDPGSQKTAAPLDNARLAPWESIAVEAVGNVIEFWGFKRNQGRVWALLYLRGEPLTAGEIERELDLSKGGVSMLLRDLERWGAVQRVRVPQDTVWRYSAETDLVRMVTHVVEEREAAFVTRIRADLSEARRLAEGVGSLPTERLRRLERMATLAEHVERALRLFIKTSRLDVAGVLGAFRDGALSRKG
ncbi:MarR family transcriptional regulator [Corallococcus praedator]|uniref:HTH-type transcriptional regulator n=1 Tax=Corallococcus praedator TaxID=2316724 RepID=A0ABX9QPY2_9BACT|nr:MULTISPECIES: MarR family transcriptional regulator [Corallococcus]RKH34424.1 MarR family transcriptional regulator [Corallococcus sp. CA031C]RKI15523.1 MarR family transcriptional regulator [Corallococcus praedator]